MSIPMLPGETPGAFISRVLDSQEFADGARIMWAAHDGTLRSLTAAGAGELAGVFALLATMVVGGVYGLFVWPYSSAEDEYRTQQKRVGFAQGLVAALIGWEWSHVRLRFLRSYIRMNEFDAQMDEIRVADYNLALGTGFRMGKELLKSHDVAKAILSAIRKAANVQTPSTWDRQTQITYVIELGVAAVRGGFVPTFR
jgi:hypothetical protein